MYNFSCLFLPAETPQEFGTTSQVKKEEEFHMLLTCRQPAGTPLWHPSGPWWANGPWRGGRWCAEWSRWGRRSARYRQTEGRSGWGGVARLSLCSGSWPGLSLWYTDPPLKRNGLHVIQEVSLSFKWKSVFDDHFQWVPLKRQYKISLYVSCHAKHKLSFTITNTNNAKNVSV